MKKGLISSYVAGVTDLTQGESYKSILRYFLPEFVTALLLYSMPFLLDAYFIGHLKSSLVYGTLGATNNLIQFFIKIAEALSISTVILGGRFNGRGDLPGVGRTLRDSFWVTGIMGLSIACFLYFGAHWIYGWYVPAELIPLGVPFLRMRAISVFFMFLVFAFFGFLRGIKNTRVPMVVFAVGSALFCFFDYVLILGNFGFPAMGLKGSALASVLQWGIMLIMVLGYVLYNPEYRKYGIKLFSLFNDNGQWKRLIHLSWPILLDKSTIAISYIWLFTMLKSLGAQGAATFSVVRDMERLTLIPAMAFAQVITFLVSNDFGAGRWDGVKNNIKKVVLLASLFVGVILLILALYPRSFIQYFDRNHEFTDVAAWVFPMLSTLVFLDIIQLVLSGAVRGTGNVRVVMGARLLVCGLFLVPVSYLFSLLPIQSVELKFLLVYGTFYVACGLISIIYIRYFRSEHWKGVANR